MGRIPEELAASDTAAPKSAKAPVLVAYLLLKRMDKFPLLLSFGRYLPLHGDIDGDHQCGIGGHAGPGGANPRPTGEDQQIQADVEQRHTHLNAGAQHLCICAG